MLICAVSFFDVGLTDDAKRGFFTTFAVDFLSIF